MKQLNESQAELLKAIKADEDFTKWLYYSIAYNNGIENAARDFAQKLEFHKRNPVGNKTSLSNIKAIIPTFVETYE